MLSLTPINTPNVNPLLHHFPEWTHIPQLINSPHDMPNNEINFSFSCEPTDTETERGVRHIFGGAKRTKDVRGLEGGRCASGA